MVRTSGFQSENMGSIPVGAIFNKEIYMRLLENKKDFFTVDFKEWIPVHCISYDCKMDAGISVPIKEKFHLQGLTQEYLEDNSILWKPTAIYYNGVINLITKKRYWHKPTYDTMRESLVSMFYLIHNNPEIGNKFAMPKIGCGLDLLKWERVKTIIYDVFDKTSLDFLVCYI